MRSNLDLDSKRESPGSAPVGVQRPLARLNSAKPGAKYAAAREQKLGATARSFAILEHVAKSPAPVDVLDIIASLKLPKATAYRLVDWFVTHGYLSREPGRRRLLVGPKLANLAFGALSASMRNDTPHVVLQRMVRTLNETCNIGTVINGDVVYLDREEYLVGVIRMSVPVVGKNGELLAALAIQAPEARMNVQTARLHLPALRRAAIELAEIFQAKV